MANSSSTSSPLGFGIVGLGMIAEFHARAIAEVSGARLVGVVTRDVEKGKTFAQKHAAPVLCSTVEELVARADVHVVCITTPSGAHLEPALTAIRAGKHVVIEKPIEITLERADELLNAAAAQGVRLAPIFQARFGEGARTVKAAIDAGRLGRLVLASAYVKWYRGPEYYTGWKGTLKLDGGGALINQSIHAVDLLQWFAGMPAEVFCWKNRCVHHGIEAEDTVAAALRYPNGGFGTIEASTAVWPGWQRRLEICGERGSIMLEDDRITRWEFRDKADGDEGILAGKDSAALGSGASAPNAIGYLGHQRQLQDFVDAIRDHRAPVIDGSEGRKAVALVRALYASADLGHAVKL